MYRIVPFDDQQGNCAMRRSIMRYPVTSAEDVGSTISSHPLRCLAPLQMDVLILMV